MSENTQLTLHTHVALCLVVAYCQYDEAEFEGLHTATVLLQDVGSVDQICQTTGDSDWKWWHQFSDIPSTHMAQIFKHAHSLPIVATTTQHPPDTPLGMYTAPRESHRSTTFTVVPQSDEGVLVLTQIQTCALRWQVIGSVVVMTCFTTIP